MPPSKPASPSLSASSPALVCRTYLAGSTSWTGYSSWQTLSCKSSLLNCSEQKTIRCLVLWSTSNQISVSLSPSLIIDSCKGSYIPEIDQPCPLELCHKWRCNGALFYPKCTGLECLWNAIIYWGKCRVPSNLYKIEYENAFKRKTNHYMVPSVPADQRRHFLQR